jgi:hypothetical protein
MKILKETMSYKSFKIIHKMKLPKLGMTYFFDGKKYFLSRYVFWIPTIEKNIRTLTLFWNQINIII